MEGRAAASATASEGIVLVNGPSTSVQGPRARALFGSRARILYKEDGRIRSTRAIWRALRDPSVRWVYCIDLGVPAAPLAALRKQLAPDVRLIYEIGDPARPLLANQGRPFWEVAVASRMDRRLPCAADALVFRGSYLAEYFAHLMPRGELPPWHWLPDGVDCDIFRPRRGDPAVAELRRRHGLEGKFVVGLVGSIHHNPVHNLFYGWELAEALATLPRESPIVGVVVGGGPGGKVLESVCVALGVSERVRLVGRVPHAEVPLWMNTFDVALSTQTDDPVGWGRTTAKLPEYLACGTVVACTDVGEAHRWLRNSGQTLPYHGMRDDDYPARLAQHLRELVGRDLEQLRRSNRALAEERFAYPVIRPQVERIVRGE